MRLQNIDTQLIKIRKIGLIPSELELIPDFPDTIKIHTLSSLNFNHLIATNIDSPQLIKGTEFNAVLTAVGQTGLNSYDVASGTSKAAFNGTPTLTPTNVAHRWDFLIETADAIIRFQDRLGNWLGTIPLTTGNHSIGFTSSNVEIADRTGAGGSTFTVIAYQQEV